MQDAKREEAARRAYKLLATLHADCAELVGLVEETGATMREIRDLEDQVGIPVMLFLQNVSNTEYFRLRLRVPRMWLPTWKGLH
jgi:hypothetical protein